MDGNAARGRLQHNPFFVLGVPANATRAEVEREGTKLLGMLELGLASAATYQTPVGPMKRTADDVREAMAALRDPERRLAHELWAQVPTRDAAERDAAEASAVADAARTTRSPRLRRWPDALRALGFGARR